MMVFRNNMGQKIGERTITSPLRNIYINRNKKEEEKAMAGEAAVMRIFYFLFSPH